MEIIDASSDYVFKSIKKEISSSPSLSLSPTTSDTSSSGYSSCGGGEITIFNKYNPPSICFICSSPAKCHHYTVPSCSGCKTFFRRTILTTPNYICKNSIICKDVKRCRFCRFDKCLTAGMNPNAVTIPPESDAAKIQAFIKKQQNRILSKMNGEEIPKLLTVMNVERNKSLQYLIFLETKLFLLRTSGDYNPSELFSLTVKDLIKKEVEISKADKFSILSKHTTFKLYLLIDIILCIDTARLLPGIQDLDETDLEILFKHSSLMLAIFTQVFYSYQGHYDTITLPNGCMPVKCMKEKNRLELECFCRCIEPVERSQITTEEYVLAKAIAICNPAIPELSSHAREILAQQREYYANILFKYEQDSYGIERGAIKYTKIMSAIEAMYHFAQRQREFHNICRIQFLIGGDNPWPNTVQLKLFEDSVI